MNKHINSILLIILASHLSCNGNLFNDGLNDSLTSIPVTGVFLNKSNTSILRNSSEQLTATITPTYATNKNVTWTTGDLSKATVTQSGLVTAGNPGTVTITVTTNDGGFKADCTVITERLAGESVIYTAGGVNFNMVYVPAKSFYINVNDSSSASIVKSFWICDTEVTYKLWCTVYSWATTDAGGGKRADGGELYYFNYAGEEGNPDVPAGKTDLHPVTCMNWCDAIVWCNAATEWYNAQNPTNLDCVYTYTGLIIRDSTFYNMCDGAVQSSTANGFRLLTENEWELAARYINDGNNDGDIMDAGEYYPGNHASGDTSSYCEPNDSGVSTIFGNYAWYILNSGGSTHEAAATSASNHLGLFDMSGNVWEWCFDLSGSQRVIKGGGYNGAAGNLQVGHKWSHIPWSSTPPTPPDAFIDTGLRIGKTN
ncbi:MAG: SUMF1/EgtB/PvdO family nonheme iron enzyme [Spirochaetota bacterium]